MKLSLPVRVSDPVTLSLSGVADAVAVWVSEPPADLPWLLLGRDMLTDWGVGLLLQRLLVTIWGFLTTTWVRRLLGH